ncbi:MAG TPA: DUF4870 domain-containing protein [Candidatus Cybelea sp.]
MQAHPASVERNWAMAAHLSALVAVAGMPFGHVLGPLVVYLMKGHESEFVGQHARASLNYQISISVFAIVATIIAAAVTLGYIVPMSSSADSPVAGFNLAALWIGFAVVALLAVLASILFIILGTLAASEGRPYTYPFAIRFLR